MSYLNDLEKTQQFVAWFREASPYIHAHRGRTFVISIAGEALETPQFPYLIHDIALLSSLGIRVVLICGIRVQIEHELERRGIESRYVDGIRITDETALSCVKAACGEVISTVESLLSMGLTNSPTIEMFINTATGNFIVARPMGIRDGIDYCYSGEVRRVNVAAMTKRLDEGCIVLIAPVGYSPTGEVFNLLAEDVAAEVAIALKAHKWVCVSETKGLYDQQNRFIQQLTLLEAQQVMNREADVSLRQQLTNAIRACQRGVQRVHLIPRQVEGSLLLELFSRDGIGTLISTDPFEHIRRAKIEDIGGLLALLEPLEESGILVRRSREKLEMEIDQFLVQERDGMIVACAALYPFVNEDMAELACLAVHEEYRGNNRGDIMLNYIEREARRLQIGRVFVLTTYTADWFRERGFQPANLDVLPMQRRALYNYKRNSKVFIKSL
ncbi:amino-acid N-acetyltransferase [Thioflexithrix psekupsensis]|uniref:Amino-acid acetyltransferase n=2 Tax=Thioflexithrix psekupsensis TaxID=1570016 RepID=A0A251XBG3_9GAMM|nr:amino-acid N-acetyltransferase [Thioflexithrix psekupsensis]